MSPELEGEEMSPELERHDRRQFLRRLGKTVAIGIGIALVPVGRANAAVVRCCTNLSICPPNRCVTLKPFYCASIGCCVCDVPPPMGESCHDYSVPPC